VKETTQSWAVEEFGRSGIEDARWRRRLVEMGRQAVRRPAGRVTEAFGDDAARQGAYGLLESEAVEPTQVAAAVFVACAVRSAEHEFVFCPVDGTSLRLVDREKAKGFGSVGSHKNQARGLKVMNAMALSPLGVPLGLTAQQWWNRPHRRRRRHRDKLPAEQKETHHWLEAIRNTRLVIAQHAPKARCWFQLDREGDAWPMLAEAGLENQWFTVRSCRNRHVLLPHRRKSKLYSLLEKQALRDSFMMQVRPGSKRRGRLGRFTIRACPVTLNLRDKRTGRRFPMTLNAVRIRESGTTPRAERPIEWVLLTNHSIETTADLHRIAFGYSMRWRIEEVHRSWKSGACRVEDTQLRSTNAVVKWATILAAVAVRIERIKQLSREEPSSPATVEFSQSEIRAAAILRFGEAGDKKVSKGPLPTIEEVALWVAKIGGYTGKSSGGPPGSITIGRGLVEVRAVAKVLDALGGNPKK
jgi:hypothetical protein